MARDRDFKYGVVQVVSGANDVIPAAPMVAVPFTYDDIVHFIAIKRTELDGRSVLWRSTAQIAGLYRIPIFSHQLG